MQRWQSFSLFDSVTSLCEAHSQVRPFAAASPHFVASVLKKSICLVGELQLLTVDALVVSYRQSPLGGALRLHKRVTMKRMIKLHWRCSVALLDSLPNTHGGFLYIYLRIFFIFVAFQSKIPLFLFKIPIKWSL